MIALYTATELPIFNRAESGGETYSTVQLRNRLLIFIWAGFTRFADLFFSAPVLRPLFPFVSFSFLEKRAVTRKPAVGNWILEYTYSL